MASVTIHYNGPDRSLAYSYLVRHVIGWTEWTRMKDAGGVSMADKDQKKKSATNKPKLTIKEKKERKERKIAAKKSR